METEVIHLGLEVDMEREIVNILLENAYTMVGIGRY